MEGKNPYPMSGTGLGGSWAGAAIGAGAQIADSIITNATNAQSTKETNETNKAINESNNDFNYKLTQEQWERDDTAYQRLAQDAKNAGINLSAIVGNGGEDNSAAIPSEVGAPMEAFQMQRTNLGSLLANSLDSASDRQRQRDYENALLSHDEERLLNERITAIANYNKNMAESKKIGLDSSILAGFGEQTAAARLENITADTAEKRASADYTRSRTQFQNISNKYLPAQLELDLQKERSIRDYYASEVNKLEYEAKTRPEYYQRKKYLEEKMEAELSSLSITKEMLQTELEAAGFQLQFDKDARKYKMKSLKKDANSLTADQRQALNGVSQLLVSMGMLGAFN